MRLSIVLAGIVCAALLVGCEPQVNREYPRSVALKVSNPVALDRLDEALVLDIGTLKLKAADFDPRACVVFVEGKETPSQVNDWDADGEADELVVLLSLPAQTRRTITLRYAPGQVKQRSYSKRTHAELSVKTGGKFVGRKYVGGNWVNVKVLRVPNEHADHSEFIRYEGPGWESDRVGYRFYLDWRNAIDVFGKKVRHMVLPNVGLDGFESYHLMSVWGMDILKVGESLGVGSVGMWVEGKAQRVSLTDSVRCEVVLDGPAQSLIRTTYWGWKVGGKSYDLVSELSITAGSRMTTHCLHIKGEAPNLCTGLVKDPSAEVLVSRGEGQYGYFATYGRQSLAGDSLGLAVVFRRSDLVTFEEDSFSHVVVLRPQEGRLTYHFLAAWEQEPGGLKTWADFVAHLQEILQKLEQPIVVE